MLMVRVTAFARVCRLVKPMLETRTQHTLQDGNTLDMWQPAGVCGLCKHVGGQ